MGQKKCCGLKTGDPFLNLSVLKGKMELVGVSLEKHFWTRVTLEKHFWGDNPTHFHFPYELWVHHITRMITISPIDLEIYKLQDSQFKKLLLTATERPGSRLPEASKMLITAEMSTIAQK